MLDAQLGVQINSSSMWRSVFDNLNLSLTLLFTVELGINLFINWFSAFWSNG